MARKSIGDIADHYEAVITKLERKPAVIGHSFGGLLTQDPRRPGPGGRFRGHRPGTVSGRAAPPDLGAAIRVTGAEEPGEPASGRPSHL
jgi:hypothetical protein